MANSVSDSVAKLTMTAAMLTADQRDAYLSSLVQTAKAAVPTEGVLAEQRARAEALLREQTFPSSRQEDWRFTDLSALLNLEFGAGANYAIAEADVAALRLPESTGAQIVVVNGQVRPEFSRLENLPAAAIAGSLRELSAHPIIQAKVSQCLAQASGSHEVFTALNTVGFQDAVVIWLPRHQIIDVPIQVLHITLPQATPQLVQPRCLVIAEAGSSLTLIEDYWGSGAEAHFTNAVTELWLEEAAQCTHARIQREGEGTVHIGKTVVTQGRDSQYTGTAAGFGARLCRHHWEVYQTGEQTTTRLYGLGAIAANQHTDTHSLVALNHPYGQVEQIHKAIVDGTAHSVFNGRIVVAQPAQLTNASQLNRNLLLSNRARVDTKPQLEIVADNVKCAHGATVSQLQADEIFYLQSRGISAAQAQRLLIYAFAMEILDRIPIESLRSRLSKAIAQQP